METENKIIFVMALLMAIGSGVGMFYNYSLVLFFACGLSLLYAIHKEERKMKEIYIKNPDGDLCYDGEETNDPEFDEM